MKSVQKFVKGLREICCQYKREKDSGKDMILVSVLHTAISYQVNFAADNFSTDEFKQIADLLKYWEIDIKLDSISLAA